MFEIIYADEAVDQLNKLDKVSRNKALKAVRNFEVLGREARNSRSLRDEIWEIKADNVRAYFKYHKDKIVIIGLIVLKKSQKAPDRFIEQSIRNIEKVIQELQEQGL